MQRKPLTNQKIVEGFASKELGSCHFVLTVELNWLKNQQLFESTTKINNSLDVRTQGKALLLKLERQSEGTRTCCFLNRGSLERFGFLNKACPQGRLVNQGLL